MKENITIAIPDVCRARANLRIACVLLILEQND